MRLNKETIQRFLDKVQPASNACWVWTASHNQHGYGKFRVGKKMERAHRVAYALFVGAIPEGRLILHSCHNPGCCSPHHLRLGSHADNSRDMVVAGRSTTGETQPTSKLTREQVMTIRKMISEGKHKKQDIAEMYEVSPTTISEIKTRRTWAWL